MTYETLVESINTFKALTSDGSITPTVLGNLLAQIAQYAKEAAEPGTAVIAEALETALAAIADASSDADDDISTARTSALDDIEDAKDAALDAIGSTVLTYEEI